MDHLEIRNLADRLRSLVSDMEARHIPYDVRISRADTLREQVEALAGKENIPTSLEQLLKAA